MAAPSRMKSGIVRSANELSSSMNCVAMTARLEGPLKTTRKTTATSVRPQAMGKPEKRTIVVTTRISRPICSSFMSQAPCPEIATFAAGAASESFRKSSATY